MNKAKLYPILNGSGLALLMLLFSYTAVSKLLEMDVFIFQMRLSPLFWLKVAAPVLAVLLPVLELLIVVLLFSERWRRLGLWGAIVLLGAFEVYILWMLLSGLHLPCTCGGVISKMSWKGHLVFNAAFIVSAYLTLVLNKPNPKSMHPFQRIFIAARSENRL